MTRLGVCVGEGSDCNYSNFILWRGTLGRKAEVVPMLTVS